MFGHGVFVCAVCDGPGQRIKGKTVAVVGGGDSAMQAALFLERYAKRVIVLVRPTNKKTNVDNISKNHDPINGDHKNNNHHHHETYYSGLRASNILVERVKERYPKILVIRDVLVAECIGEKHLEKIALAFNQNPSHCTYLNALQDSTSNSTSNSTFPSSFQPSIPTKTTGSSHGDQPWMRTIDCSGLFFSIGHDPATSFLHDQILLDEESYILTEPGGPRTSVEGVFACGDVQDKKWRQAITAAASGCTAAIEAIDFLNNTKAKL